ncbi:MAG: hypothetical protein ACKVS6_17095 [Planctomycetota bacterium]
MLRYLLPANLLLASLAGAQVATILPFAASSDLLVGDSNGGRILRITANTLESGSPQISVYFDPVSAIDITTGQPYGAILGTPAAITSDLSGRIFIAAQTTFPRVFRLVDLNNDGDAQDSGESTVFVDGSQISNFSNSTANGIAVDPNGTAWVTSDAATGDWVYKFTDIDNNGNANDAGEIVEFYNDGTYTANGGSPLFNVAWAGFTPSGKFYMTNAASFHQFVVTLDDVSNNGTANDFSDVSTISLIGKCRCARFGRDGRLYMFNTTTKVLVASNDQNNNSYYSDPGETVTFAQSSVSTALLQTGQIFDIRADGAVVFGDTGASAKLVIWKDNNQNGVATDPADTTISVSFAGTAFPNAQPRSVFFLPVEPAQFGTACNNSTGFPGILSWDRDGGLPKPGNLNFSLDVDQAPPGSLVGVMYSGSDTSISFDSLLPGLSDPACLLYLDIFDAEFNTVEPLQSADANGHVTIPIALPQSVAALAGLTFYLQALVYDPSAALPITLTNGVALPLL